MIGKMIPDILEIREREDEVPYSVCPNEDDCFRGVPPSHPEKQPERREHHAIDDPLDRSDRFTHSARPQMPIQFPAVE